MKKISKNHKAAPPVRGFLQCKKGHQWDVKDLNQERKAVVCPVCGDYTAFVDKNGKLAEGLAAK